MFEPLATIPEAELRLRHQKCRTHLAETAPGAEGLLAFSRLNIYYLTGHLGMGCVWLPMEGEPVVLLRKGEERARMESPLENILTYKSYSQLAPLAAEAGSPMGSAIAAEMGGLTWQLAELLKAKFPGVAFSNADNALALARAQKSEWELTRMRRCGALHHRGLFEMLPERIHPGMTEREVALKAWDVFYELGHVGIMRMQAHGEEIFLGHVSAGNSGNYPGSFNGPLGVSGSHPSAPYMGSPTAIWQPGTPLSCDIGFAIDGYCTDKTQVYWAGTAENQDPEVRAAHSFGMDVQAYLQENIKPGAIPSELWQGCLDMAEKAGMSEGFMGLDGNKVVFVGHGIGLSIDGFPVIAKGFDKPMEQGNVVALEPKQAVRGKCMVGVENTFEVTADGAKCISGHDYDILCVE